MRSECFIMERVKEYRLLRQWSREWAVAVCRFFSFVGQEIEPRASYMPGECSAIELHHHLGYKLSLRLLKRALNLPSPVSTSGVTGYITSTGFWTKTEFSRFARNGYKICGKEISAEGLRSFHHGYCQESCCVQGKRPGRKAGSG